MGRLDHLLPLSFGFFNPCWHGSRWSAYDERGRLFVRRLRSAFPGSRSQISNPAYHVSYSQAFSLKVLDRMSHLTTVGGGGSTFPFVGS